MKHLYLFVTLLISVYSFAQEIPNNGFEEWVPQILYSDPQGWDTPNDLTATFGQTMVTKSDDAYSGSFSVKMESKQVLSLAAPGGITLGTFDVDLVNQTAGVSGGIAFNQRPVSLKGFYKSTPVENDSTVIFIYFYKEEMFDSIGYGFKFFSQPQEEWTEFEIPIEWDSDEEPDTMNIVMISGASYTDPKPGSVLMVDDVHLEMESGIAVDVFQKVETEIMPNPALEEIRFSFGKSFNKAQLFIYNDAGIKVYSAEISGTEYTANIQQLAAGSYVYHVIENHQRRSSGVFLKQ